MTLRTANIDPTGTYRYLLTRQFSGPIPGPGIGAVLWIMLNPSTADASIDDATIRKISGFSKRWGANGLRVANLFALRSTDPKVLKTHADPVGPENDQYIREALSDEHVTTVICAWGNHGTLLERDLAVYRLIQDAGRVPTVLGLNKTGARRQPVHPLYQRDDTLVSVWGGP